MKQTMAAVSSVVAARAVPSIVSCATATTSASTDAEDVSRAGMYEAVRDWPQLPRGLKMGETSAVAVDRNGHVFAFHRPGRGFEPDATALLTEPTVLQIGPDTGKLLNSWGANMFLVPHGLTVDRDGHQRRTEAGPRLEHRRSDRLRSATRAGVQRRARHGGWTGRITVCRRDAYQARGEAPRGAAMIVRLIEQP